MRTTELRERALERLAEEQFDVIVIGGGINGAAAALALSTHGARVGCVTRADLASGTSESSSNYAWGGFKYLESYEIALVAKLCASRNRLARAFPTRLVETRFLATLDQTAPHRPWFAALGANAYWILGRFFTRRPRLRRPTWIASAEPAVDVANTRGGIEYSDYLIADNDARFVAQMLFDAADHGAAVANYADVVGATWDGARWRVDIVDRVSGRQVTATAAALVNAAGPRADEIGEMTGTTTEHRVVLSKGIHVIVPQLSDSRRVLAFYDDSRRLFYVIPMGHRSVVGTTDTRTDDPDEGVTDAERRELLDQINRRLAPSRALGLADIIGERVGVRPLVVKRDAAVDGVEWTALSRRHAVETDRNRRVISILGGKLTDCTNVGKEVVAAAGELGLPVGRPTSTGWFGEPGAADRASFLRVAERGGLGWRPRFERESTQAEVVWRRYGKRAWRVLDLVTADPSLGRSMMELADFCEAEIVHTRLAEMIVRIEDFLRRRTPLLQLNRPADLLADEGVRRAVEILAGPDGLADLAAMTAHGVT